MAEGDVANVSLSAEEVEEILRCPICWDRFKTPKLLPCQHTFCQTPCLEQLVNRFDKIKCPECRLEHRVPYSGVSGFPNNRTIAMFLDLATRAQSSVPQQTASQQLPANERAGQANNSANQRPQPPARSQSAVEVLQPPEVERTACSACNRQVPLSRCSHCDNIVCDACKRSHLDQLRLDINRLVSQLRRGIPAFSDAISVIENKSEQLHQRAEAGKAEITETIERYISELRNRQRALHSEVQMWLLGEIRSLRMCQENVEVELASTASFCDSTEAVLSRANQTIPDEDLVDLKRQCVEHMEIIRAYEDGGGLRLPRERRVQVAFEGNRFSQAISNFGDMSVLESQDNSSASGGTSNPPSLNSRSSSSREPSPAGAIGGAGRGQSPSQDSRAFIPAPVARGQNSTLDRALAAIGSHAGSLSPRVPHPRNEERIGGMMGGGGASRPSDSMSPSPRLAHRTDVVTGGGATGQAESGNSNNRLERGAPGGASSSDSPSNTARPTPRERLAGLLGTDVTPNQQRQTTGQATQQARERTAGLIGGVPDTQDATSGAVQQRRQLPQNLSWELPLDFSYPPRGEIRVGNGVRNRTSGTNNRRSLQERRRHNLSDSRLPALLGGIGTGNQNGSNRMRNRSGERTSPRNAQLEPVPGTSGENSDRPPLVRSRTYTREEFQTIREEDSSSRASSADATTRQRTPVRFDVELAGIGGGENDDITYMTNTVDGGESVRVNVAENNYQDKGRAIIRFGKRGSNESEFVWPRGISVSRADQIYIADSSNHRVQVFDNIGTYVKTFGSYGQGDAEFDCLAGVCINTMGEILITDRYNHRIQVFDHQGTFKFRFGEEGNGDGQMCYPWGIATDGMGFVYVCDKENHRVQVFQSNGVFVRKFGQLGRMPGQFENPHYLAVSPDNKIYVSDSSNHRIQVFTIYGDYIMSFGSIGTMQGQMKYPKGIAIDEQGFVVVADSGNNRIQVFRGDGRFYCMFGSYGSDNGQFKGIEGLAILNNGNVVVSDRENHRIQIF